MSLWITLLLMFTLVAGASAQSPSVLIPVSFGAQWPVGAGGYIASTCQTPNLGGTSCLFFPQGAILWGIVWQSSVKTFPHEVLFHMVLSQSATQLGASLMSTHHIGVNTPTILIKTIALPQPIQVSPGWYIWVYADGAASSGNAAPIEFQATLYMEPTVVIPQ